jgi:hypothetical protein
VLVWEVPVLGPTFAASRWVVALLVPIAVGLVVPLVLRVARAI